MVHRIFTQSGHLPGRDAPVLVYGQLSQGEGFDELLVVGNVVAHELLRLKDVPAQQALGYFPQRAVRQNPHPDSIGHTQEAEHPGQEGGLIARRFFAPYWCVTVEDAPQNFPCASARFGLNIRNSA